MKRFPCLASAFAMALTLALVGCDSGGDLKEGAPPVDGYKGVESAVPKGMEMPSMNMGDQGIKPKAATKGGNPATASPK